MKLYRFTLYDRPSTGGFCCLSVSLRSVKSDEYLHWTNVEDQQRSVSISDFVNDGPLQGFFQRKGILIKSLSRVS